jgi:hypothetical protein
MCGFCSNILAFPCGLGYFIHLFRTRIQSVIDRMTQYNRPKYIFVCMIYFLDEMKGNSWAETALSALQYNSNPQKLQAVIKKLFDIASKHVIIEGSHVIAVPLFEALDGKCSDDYIQRVEPSAQGGSKMGKLIADTILSTTTTKMNQVESGIMER